MNPENRWTEDVAKAYLAFAAVALLSEILPAGRKRIIGLAVVMILAILFLGGIYRVQADRAFEGSMFASGGASGAAT